jgi:DNA-binding transcriptional regulator YdaS (Cro superfamily)
MQNPIIKEAAKKVGGVVAMSIKLGMSRGAVSQWDEVPAERVVAVEILTGVPRARLRPDMFDTATGCEASATQKTQTEAAA